MQTDSTLKENVTHGTKKNPITGIRFRAGAHTMYPDHFFVDLHWHHSIEIISIVKGSYLFEINLETYRLNAGDICFPTTSAMREALNTVVMDAYRGVLEQQATRAAQAVERLSERSAAKPSLRGALQNAMKDVAARPPQEGQRSMEQGAR